MGKWRKNFGLFFQVDLWNALFLFYPWFDGSSLLFALSTYLTLVVLTVAIHYSRHYPMDHHPPCIVATVVAVARNTRSSLDDIWHYLYKFYCWLHEEMLEKSSRGVEEEEDKGALENWWFLKIILCFNVDRMVDVLLYTYYGPQELHLRLQCDKFS